MMFGGKLIRKSRKKVEGSYRQHAYNDSWLETMDIEYEGELTGEVCAAIIAAFLRSSACTKGESSWGKLRWSSPDRVERVDVENRKLVIACSENLCD